MNHGMERFAFQRHSIIIYSANVFLGKKNVAKIEGDNF